MRSASFKVLMALAVTVAMVTVFAIPVDAGWSLNAGTRTISAGQYSEIGVFSAQDNAEMWCNVTKNSGPQYFDVLLMDKANFDIYKSGGNAFVYHSASNLSDANVFMDTGVGGLTSGTEYHLVIDNTDRPAGGAVPDGTSLNVWFSYVALNVQPVVDMTLIIIMLAVVAAIAVAIVILFLYFNSRKKKAQPQMQAAQPTFQPTQPGIKRCPQCGGEAMAEYMFCPRCGFKY